MSTKVRQILKDHQIEGPPVPIERIAEERGIKLKYEPFDGELSGMVYRSKEGDIVIGINSAHAQTRRRFSIAHELAHIVLHKDETLHIDERYPIGFRSAISSLAIDKKEIEANRFAADVLMPKEFLEKDLKKLPQDITTVDDAIKYLARLYVVSVQAMTIRLSKLHLIE